jgi:dTDP-4-dehydrorhamnose reductase
MILICGASGLVGKEMCNYLDSKQVNYIGTYNKNKIDKTNMFQIDFSNHDLLEKFILFHKITCCIFCIVERLTDVCENNWNEIKKTNIDLVHTTSYICSKFNIKFIHLSTDYVFDGLKQPNLPDSYKNPLQNYGISKLISEYRVIKNCKNYCIIRTPVLYTPLSKIHDNAVCLIGKNIMDLRKDKKYKEDNYSIRRPLFILDLCTFIYDCLDKNFIGIFHFYNPNNKFTKYEICKLIGKYLDINLDKIEPNNCKSEGIAPRPYDTQLIDNNINVFKKLLL